jgi:hypothetical protein
MVTKSRNKNVWERKGWSSRKKAASFERIFEIGSFSWTYETQLVLVVFSPNKRTSSSHLPFWEKGILLDRELESQDLWSFQIRWLEYLPLVLCETPINCVSTWLPNGSYHVTALGSGGGQMVNEGQYTYSQRQAEKFSWAHLVSGRE